MNLAKIDTELRRALQQGAGPFSILVRFRPPIDEAEGHALKLTGRGEIWSGHATAGEIETLSDRDDVVGIGLVTPPELTRTGQGS